MKSKLNKAQIASLEILRDEDPMNPREWDNLGTMACWHRRSSYGDVQPKEDPKTWLEKNAPKGSVELPIYMMDHSGVSLRTSSGAFQAADPQGWDWGRLGVIVATPDDIRKNFMVKRITKKILEKTKQVLESEVETYNLFINGECWGYIITDGDGEEDSCWGFLGSTLEETGLAEAVPEAARPLLEEAWNQRS